MTGLMLAFCSGLLLAMWSSLSVAPFQACLLFGLLLGLSLVLPSAPSPFAKKQPQRLLALAAAALMGLLHWQACMDNFRRQQMVWLADSQPLTVAGHVAGLPNCNPEQCRFVLQADLPRSGTLALGWREGASLNAGDHCKLTVQLRPYWSLLNPAGFDAETVAFSQGRGVNGTVIHGRCEPALGLAADWQRGRQQLSLSIGSSVTGPAAALLPALVTGDRSAMQPSHWQLLSATGTAHLMAISGLHVSLVASFGFLPALALAILLQGRGPPLPVLAATSGAIAALAYSSLAGWSISTQRACLMLLTPLAAMLFRRQWPPLSGLLVALTLILLISPQSATGRGLWMSFGAVAVLLTVFWGRAGQRIGRGWLRLLPVQLSLLIGMAPLQLAMGVELSAGFIVINLIAVPWVSLVILPLTLLGSVALLLGFAGLLELAAWNMNQLWNALQWTDQQLAAQILIHPAPLALVGLLSACLLAPRRLPGWKAQLPGVLALLLVIGRSGQRPTSLHVFDVGQGTAVLFSQSDQAFLFDTGPGSEDGWNAGSGVLWPSFIQLGITRVDQIVISHADSDHAGGIAGLQHSSLQIDALMGVSSDARWPPCRSGREWQWADSRIRSWHPGPWLPYLGNDSSCVFSLSRHQQQVVLPGDIGAIIERRLLQTELVQQHSTKLLILGHHGSSTSTSYQWLEALKPALAVATNGHENRFDMPHFMVRHRLAQRQTALLSSAECGHLQFAWSGPSLQLVSAQRLQRGRAWHWPGLCPEPPPAPGGKP